jgi:signal transduction histidine kinase
MIYVPLFISFNILIVSTLSISTISLAFFLMYLSKKKGEVSNALEKNNSQLLLLQKKLENKNIETAELQSIVTNQKEQLAAQNNELVELNNTIDNEVLKRTSRLHILLEKSEESNKLKDAFLEKISRELRTPLNAILGFINLLNNPDLLDHDRAYFYKFIQDSGNNLLSLIDNIIDFSKLETNELQIEPKVCRLHVLLTDLVDKYRNKVIRENKDLIIIFNKPEQDVESIIDCKRVIHIADQLLSNAMKYTQEGKIEIVYEIKDDKHLFSVSDTGIGINKKYQDIIFERFYQIEPDTQDVFHGAGLGLTIAKSLVDLLGGKIWLKSEAGNGATFTFTLPFIDVDKHSLKGSKHKDHYNWKNKRILIAEDEDSNFHYLVALLRKTKATILRAEDGIKFLEIMDENKNIDLVLLDIKMPGINGFNAIKVVRQQNITIPVIAQTAFNQPEDKQRCLDSGCNDYLSKPIDKDLLLNKIARFFEK